MEKTINYDLNARKWAISIHILNVAIKRRVSPQLVRAEILTQCQISAGLLSLLEKTDKQDTKNTLTITIEDRLNAYFSRELQKQIVLNGNAALVAA